MSFQGLTPEAFVERSDSKNPATTCKGLTANGRPCRRSLGSTPSNSPGPSPIKTGDGSGVVAILDEENAAAFFCWQHKDQAENLIAKMQQDSRRTTIVPLQKRSSIDTLAEKVGVLDLEDEVDVAQNPLPVQMPGKRKVHQRSGRVGLGETVTNSERRRVKKRDTLPQEWQHIQGPLMSVPEEVMQEALPEKTESRPRPRPRPSQSQQRQRHGQPNVKASWGCCFRADADNYNDDGPPVRRREKREYRYEQRNPRPQSYHSSSHRPNASTGTKPPVTQLPLMQQRPSQTWQPQSQPHTPTRPPPQRLTTASSTSPPHAQTQSLLSLIPSNLDPTTTSLLLSELSKPLPADDEPGYIYIFWLTPTSDPAKPDDDIASTLLDDDSLSYQNDLALYPSLPDLSPSRTRRPSTSDVSPRRRKHESTQQALQRFASIKKTNSASKILLKIGRAQNVHRRMTQWTKQCNQNITLVRYYPPPTSATDPVSPGGIKVPHVVRVERLIHIELRGLGMGKKDIEKCLECGREHREWFEVPATKEGLRIVDGTVRRWVAWGESAE